MWVFTLTLFAWSVSAKSYANRTTGHWGDGMTKEIANCNYTMIVEGSPSCQQVADSQYLSLSAFQTLNPWLDCTLPVCNKCYVCLQEATNASDSTNSTNPWVGIPASNSSSLSSGGAVSAIGPAGIPLGAGSANKPIFTGTVAPRKTVTSTVASFQTSKAVNNTSSASSIAAISTEVPENPPQTQPPPPPSAGCTPFACAGVAASDNPPDFSSYGFAMECLNLINWARNMYNPSAGPLQWDNQLAAYAEGSAEYSSRYDCSECHTNSGPGTSWGQNLYLGQCSCGSAYFGWIINEAMGMDPANPDQGHFENIVGFAAPYSTVGCGVSSVGGQCSLACDFGL